MPYYGTLIHNPSLEKRPFCCALLLLVHLIPPHATAVVRIWSNLYCLWLSGFDTLKFSVCELFLGHAVLQLQL